MQSSSVVFLSFAVFLSSHRQRPTNSLVLLILTVPYGNVGDEKTDIILVQQVAHISTTIPFKMEFHCQKVPAANNYFYFTSCLRTHSLNFLILQGHAFLFGLKTSGGEVSCLFQEILLHQREMGDKHHFWNPKGQGFRFKSFG